MSSWNWFHGKKEEPTKTIYTKMKSHRIDYENIARNKNKSIEFIKTNPNVLFDIVVPSTHVEFSNNCFGLNHDLGCCDCYHHCNCFKDDDSTFLDLLVKYKTLTEKDFIDIDQNTKNGIPLNWRELAKRVPLSNTLLLEKADIIDWEEVSKPYSEYYNMKNADFLRLFHKYLLWDKIERLTLNADEACELVFHENIVPISLALKLQILSVTHLMQYRTQVIPHIHHMLGRYNISDIDLITEGYVDYITADSITEFKKQVERFIDKCIYEKYMPRNLKEVAMYALVSKKDLTRMKKEQFMTNCVSSETFLEELIAVSKNDANIMDIISKLPLSDDLLHKYEDILNWKFLFTSRQFDVDRIAKHLDANTKENISKHQKLSPEFIDTYCDSLDWYELCEHQVLPEWLLRKHIHKINWGQISEYQRLSQSFVKEYHTYINHTRYERNKTYRQYINALHDNNL